MNASQATLLGVSVLRRERNLKRTDLPFRFRLAVSKIVGKASADGTSIQMRLIGDDRIWSFGQDAEFELHEDGCFIRTAREAIAVPYSSIAYLVTE